MAPSQGWPLYGKILLVTNPLLTLAGMILGYLIMTSRTTGESAYTRVVRFTTPLRPRGWPPDSHPSLRCRSEFVRAQTVTP